MRIMPWCAILAVAGNVAASGLPQTHDGFFLNTGVGFAGGGMQLKSEFGNVDYTGTTTLVNIRIGGCPIPDLAFSADFQGISLGSVSMKSEGVSQKLDNDFSMTVFEFAFGVTYYIPELLFVGANIAPVGSLTINSIEETESYGGDMLGYSFRIGREWWVSSNWGLGVEFAYMHSTISDVDIIDTDGIDWITNTYGILFTATFN